MRGFHEFLYEPDKPLHGELSDYACHQRGAQAALDRQHSRTFGSWKKVQHPQLGDRSFRAYPVSSQDRYR